MKTKIYFVQRVIRTIIAEDFGVIIIKNRLKTEQRCH